jgi:hypothetical protein
MKKVTICTCDSIDIVTIKSLIRAFVLFWNLYLKMPSEFQLRKRKDSKSTADDTNTTEIG